MHHCNCHKDLEYTEGYNESTEQIDAVYILPLTRLEPTTMTTPPSTTPDIDATNCATEIYIIVPGMYVLYSIVLY